MFPYSSIFRKVKPPSISLRSFAGSDLCGAELVHLVRRAVECADAVVCRAGDRGVAGADRRSISRNCVGSGANGEVHEHLPAIGDDVFADPVAGSIDTRLLVEADRVGEEGFKVGVDLAGGECVLELDGAGHGLFEDLEHALDVVHEGGWEGCLLDAACGVVHADLGDVLDDVGFGLGGVGFASCLAGLVEPPAQGIQIGAALGERLADKDMVDLLKRILRARILAELDDATEDAFGGRLDIGLAEDVVGGEVGPFGDACKSDALVEIGDAFGITGLCQPVEFLLDGAGRFDGGNIGGVLGAEVVHHVGDGIALVDELRLVVLTHGLQRGLLTLGAEEFLAIG